MATLKIVKEAIAALKDRTGSSLIAINRWIEAEKKVSQFIVESSHGVCCAFSAKECFLSRSNFRLKLGEDVIFPHETTRPPSHTHDRIYWCKSGAYLGFISMFWAGFTCGGGATSFRVEFCRGMCDVNVRTHACSIFLSNLLTSSLSPYYRPKSRNM